MSIHAASPSYSRITHNHDRHGVHPCVYVTNLHMTARSLGSTDYISGPVPAPGDTMDAYLHAELQRIDDLVNDVEMQVWIHLCMHRDPSQAFPGTPLGGADLHRFGHKHSSSSFGGDRTFHQ